MNPAISNSATAATQSMPPLPDLSTNPGGGVSTPGDPMAAMISGIMPVKSEVDTILGSLKKLASLGLPAQMLDQIAAAATSLLPMAIQATMGTPGAGPAGPQSPPPMDPSQLGAM